MALFDIVLNDSYEVLKGDILLAEPFLADPNFNRTVVLVCEHNEQEGSFGLVINRPTEFDVDEVVEDLFIDKKLYIGGPVEQNTLHFIHKFPELPHAIPLKNGLYWGGDFEVLKSYSVSGKLTPSNCRFFMGYSGWGKEQLHQELLQDSWIIARVNLEHIFDVEPEQLWLSVLGQLGSKYKPLSNLPSDPRLN